MAGETYAIPKVPARALTPDEKNVCERVDLGNATKAIEKLRERIGGNVPMSKGAEIKATHPLYKDCIFMKYVDLKNQELGSVIFCPNQEPPMTGVGTPYRYCQTRPNTDDFTYCSSLDSYGRVSGIQYENGKGRSFDTYWQD